VEGLGRRYGEKWVVQDVSFEVPAGEFLSIVGPSGCGKSTTLRLLSGLDRPDSGEIFVGDQLVSSARGGISLAAEHRDVGFVFQSYALWPHLSVFEHVAYPLHGTGLSRTARELKVDETLALVGLDGLRLRYPSELSGGQQQRVALARALVKEPHTLLLDEPLSNLDAELRGKMARELRSLQQRLGFTAIYVTHDRVEALSLSDRVMVMQEGRSVEFGTPLEIYEHPVDVFSATFVSGANLLPGTVLTVGPDIVQVSLSDSGIPIEVAAPTRVTPLTVGEAVVVAVRPETLDVARPGDTSNVLRGTLESSTYFGAHVDLLVRVGNTTLTARIDPHRAHALALVPGQSTGLHLPASTLVALRPSTTPQQTRYSGK
jgi:iron(III) transport system ATP-binding protein